MNFSFCGKTENPISSCPTHFHKEWEIIYNTSGENYSKIKNQTFKISAADIMIIPPHISHSGFSDASYTDMYIQAKELDFSGITVVHDYDENICELFLMLHKTFLQKDNNYANICDCLLDTICQYIKKYTNAECTHTFIYDVKDCIYENISNSDFKVSHIADRVGYNIDYVRRCFAAETGKTLREYLLDLRIALAKKLLLQENFISIENVALKCGFADSFYFSTLFKKKVGTTPGAYKKSHES